MAEICDADAEGFRTYTDETKTQSYVTVVMVRIIILQADFSEEFSEKLILCLIHVMFGLPKDGQVEVLY